MAAAPKPRSLLTQATSLDARKIDADLPTAEVHPPRVPFVYQGEGDPPTLFPHLNTLTTVPPFAHDDKWVRESIDPSRTLAPFAQIPGNTCYRNAALSALFNCSPFLNFLAALNGQRIADNTSGTMQILPNLAQLARRTRMGLMTTGVMGAFWQSLGKRPVENGTGIPIPPDGWGVGANATAASGMDDPVQLVNYMFQRIVASDLAASQTDPDDPTMTLIMVFQRLFQFSLISRVPFHCSCGDVKNRQIVSREGFVLEPMNCDRPMQLRELLSTQLFQVNSRSLETWDPRCPRCGVRPASRNAFLRYAYLPEVLLFGITYVSDENVGGKSTFTNSSQARLDYPEDLDMANVRDNVKQPADGDTTYRLQSLVCGPSGDPAPGRATQIGHWIAYLRRDGTQWTELDDLKAGQRAPTRSLAYIRSGVYRPRMLMYVRVHPAQTKETPPTGAGNDVTDGTTAPPVKTGDGRHQPNPDTPPKTPANKDTTDDAVIISPDPPSRAKHLQVAGRPTPPATKKSPKTAVTNEDTPTRAPRKAPPRKAPRTTADAPESPKTLSIAPAPDTTTKHPRSEEDDALTPTSAERRLGPLEGDPTHYPFDKTMPPGRLMNIIRAAGRRRERDGRGVPGGLRAIRRTARESGRRLSEALSPTAEDGGGEEGPISPTRTEARPKKVKTVAFAA